MADGLATNKENENENENHHHRNGSVSNLGIACFVRRLWRFVLATEHAVGRVLADLHQ
jgi:hypothetical protein